MQIPFVYTSIPNQIPTNKCSPIIEISTNMAKNSLSSIIINKTVISIMDMIIYPAHTIQNINKENNNNIFIG